MSDYVKNGSISGSAVIFTRDLLKEHQVKKEKDDKILHAFPRQNDDKEKHFEPDQVDSDGEIDNSLVFDENSPVPEKCSVKKKLDILRGGKRVMLSHFHIRQNKIVKGTAMSKKRFQLKEKCVVCPMRFSPEDYNLFHQGIKLSQVRYELI